MRAAGRPSNKTVGAPMMMSSGGPTQTHMSPMHDAGNPPMMMVGAPGPVIGPPT